MRAMHATGGVSNGWLHTDRRSTRALMSMVVNCGPLIRSASPLETMTLLFLLLDIMAVGAAFAFAWFWLKASACRFGCVSCLEAFDKVDLNGIAVLVNRAQTRNARAVEATALAAALAGTRIALGLVE